MEEKRISQKELCDALNIKTSTFSNWKVRQTDPPVKYIMPICNYLNVSYTDLIAQIEVEEFYPDSSEPFTLAHNNIGDNNIIGTSNSVNKNPQNGIESEFFDLFNGLSLSAKAKVISLATELSEGENAE